VTGGGAAWKWVLMGKRIDPARARQIQWALDEYERPLVGYAHRITGDLDRARDVVQETFLKLWGAEPGVDDGRLATWLFKVCRNAAVSVLRKEQRMSQTDQTELWVDEGRPGPEAAAEQAEQVGRAVAAMNTLPGRQQEILRLKFQNGFTYKQIAEITALTATNVGFLIHTGVKRIQELLQAQA